MRLLKKSTKRGPSCWRAVWNATACTTASRILGAVIDFEGEEAVAFLGLLAICNVRDHAVRSDRPAKAIACEAATDGNPFLYAIAIDDAVFVADLRALRKRDVEAL